MNISFHNNYHIGDNLMSLRFIYSINDLLKERKIKIDYYYNYAWKFNKFDNLLKYIDSDVVTLKDILQKPQDSIDLWVNNDIDGINHTSIDLYHDKFFKKILKHLNMDNLSINTNLFIEEPFLNNVYDKLDNKYKNIDILIINSLSYSGCGNTNIYTKLTNLCKNLNNKFNIVTTDYINDEIKNVENLSLQEIGAISTRAKYIISITTSPLVCCLNKYTKLNVKKWFFISSNFDFTPLDHMHIHDDFTPIEEFFNNL